jgi:hypothetical protein
MTEAPTSAPGPVAPRSRLVVWLGVLRVGDRLLKRGDEIDRQTEAELMRCRNWKAMIGSGKLRRVEPDEWRRLHTPKVEVRVPPPVRAPSDYLIELCVAEALKLLHAGSDWNRIPNAVDSTIAVRALGQFAELYGGVGRRQVDGFWDFIRERVRERVEAAPKPRPPAPKPPSPLEPRPAA